VIFSGDVLHNVMNLSTKFHGVSMSFGWVSTFFFPNLLVEISRPVWKLAKPVLAYLV
jgi:hypothetical protein